MADLDFTALRADVETATRQPAFAEIERRSRRNRVRQRVTVAATVAATVAVLTPIALFGGGVSIGRPTPLGPDGRVGPAPTATTDQPTRTVELRSAAGTGLDRMYGAVDACVFRASSRHCSLQVTRLDQAQRPIATGLLRSQPTDELGDDVRLVQLTEGSLLLSASRGGQRVYVMIDVNGGTEPVAKPAVALPLNAGDPLVQLGPEGDLLAVRQSDDRLSLLRSQPGLTKPSLVSGVAPGLGWWVTGVDATGAPAIAVSHDQGATWAVSRLDLDRTESPIAPPTVVTPDGRTAFLFVNTGGIIVEERTDNGGLSWTRQRPQLPWPADLVGLGKLFGREFGAVARPDGSLLIWIKDAPAPIFLESGDGVTYQPAAGPEGWVLAIPGGYVTTDTEQPQFSRDTLTWTRVPGMQVQQPDASPGR